MKSKTILFCSLIIILVFMACSSFVPCYAQPPVIPAPSEQISGIKTQTISGNSFFLYENQESVSAICFILIPTEEAPEEFMEQTEWSLFAQMDRFDIALLSALWEEPSGISYYEDVYDCIAGSGDYQNVFLIGYDEAADFAATEAAGHTARYDGLVTLGGNGIQAQIMEESSKGEDTALSVWIINTGKTSANTKNLAFWKERNKITGSSLQSWKSRFADELFLPAASSADGIDPDNRRMGIVIFSREEEYRIHTVSGTIARNFISSVTADSVCFRDPLTGGEIMEIHDPGFSYNRFEYQGQQRDCWIYVPDQRIKEVRPYSLILCLHGSGGNGEDMIFRSGWHENAAAMHSIILYPSSLYKNGYQHYWQNIPEEISFIRYLVEYVCCKFPVDPSRIYVTGYSNGAGMAQNLVIRCSDLFAAAALSAPVYFDEEYAGPMDPEKIKESAILFSYGEDDPYLEYFDNTAEINDVPAIRHLEFWRRFYGFEQNDYQYEKKGKFRIYTYQSRNMIPVCQWIIVDEKKHSYPKEEVPIYFDFLRHYTRGEEGELYYDGTLVRSAGNIAHP